MITSGKFYGKFDVMPIDGRLWRLQNKHNLWWYRLDDGRIISPPDGMMFDFASVPRIFWPIFPPTGNGEKQNYGQAACIHDWLYGIHEVCGKEITRHEADRILLDGMKALKVSRWARYTIYYAVVCFGSRAWKANKDVDAG